MNYLLIWILIESVFYYQFLCNRARLQKEVKPKRPLNSQERKQRLKECLDTIGDIRPWAEGWFYYAKDKSHPAFEEIQRDNLALWLAWAFYHDHLENVRREPVWANEIEWMVNQAETRFGVQFRPGYNDRLCCIRLNLDPIEANHRPLVVYVGLYLCTLVFNVVFLQWCWGMTATVCEHSWGGPLALLGPLYGTAKTQVGYWSRGTKSEKTPVVFMHGLGAGLMGYAEFIHQLLSMTEDRPVFLIELPYVSMRLVDHVPTAEQTVEAIQAMLHRHGHTQAVFVAHSLGTAVASWIEKYASEMSVGTVMVDPICFLLHHHHVAFNFMHRAPRALMEYFLCYGVSRELHINHYISRHLQWFETIHFAKDLVNTSIFLSEKDRIVGSPLVYGFLKERKVDVHLMPRLEHAQFLLDSEWKGLILDSIDKVSRKADFFKKTKPLREGEVYQT